jgi:hypothetical protein
LIEADDGFTKKERMMSKAATISNLLIGILILLIRCGPTLASDRPDAAPIDATKELKVLIDTLQQKIEKLQSTVEQQQQRLDKINSDSAVKPAAVPSQDKVNDVEVIKGELEAVADSAAQANQRITKIESDVTASSKTLDAQGKQLGNFNFSGDIRLRYEPFFQEGLITRQRERIRARLNLTGKLSDEFSGGISLATGTLDDPVSTNQTMTGFFNRKNIGIDKAYITYKPKYAKFLKLEAGKFAYPWYRTAMTFDNDVNPEGFAETMSFDVNSSVLKNITVVGFQLPINESSSAYDSFIFGGQIQSQYRINSKMRLSLYGAGININRANPIAVAVGKGDLKPSLSNSNTFTTITKTVNGVKTVEVTGYARKFAYLDAIMKLEIDTTPRFPTTILFDFVNNVRGSRERSGYWTELTVGKTKEAKDMQFGYAFIRIEKDAVISAWNESDLRSSTNVRNHRLSFAYMLKRNLTGQFTAWIGSLANPMDNLDLVPSGVRGKCSASNPSCDPSLKRLQFDLIYKF